MLRLGGGVDIVFELIQSAPMIHSVLVVHWPEPIDTGPPNQEVQTMMFTTAKKRLFAGVASASVLALTLGACATNSEEPTASDSALETDPALISGDITFSTWWAYADQAVIDQFEELYPNVNVTLEFTAIDGYPTKLQALASSGDLPDVFAVQGQPLTDLADAGQLYDFTEALETPALDLDGTWGDSFVPSLLSGANAQLASVATEGEIYGLPFNAISVASIYNMDIFSEVGIEPPTDFDGLISNCKALSAAGYIPMSLTGAVWGSWWAYLALDQTLFGSDVADFDVSNPEYIRAYEIIAEMVDAGCWAESQVTTDIAAETALFLQKETAQFISVPENFLGAVVEGADFEIGTYVLPALAGKEPNRILGGGAANVIAVSADSENHAAAVAFAKFLTSSQLQSELAGSQFTIPSINIDLSSSNPLMGAFLEAAGNGFLDGSTYLPAFTAEGGTAWNTEVLPGLYFGNLSGAEAAAATAGLFEQ